MAIKTPNKALNIRVGKVSGNTDIFVFGLSIIMFRDKFTVFIFEHNSL